MNSETIHMQRPYILISSILILLSTFSFAQDIKFAGTRPPDTAVLNLFGPYEKASTNFKTVAERDARRKPLLSEGYFYHVVYIFIKADSIEEAEEIASANLIFDEVGGSIEVREVLKRD